MTEATTKQLFPVVAQHEFGLMIKISWGVGTISHIYQYHESEARNASWEESKGHESSYILAGIVQEAEFEILCRSLFPLINEVVAGYSFQGHEEQAQFTEAAEDALEEIQQLIENFGWEFSEQFGPDPQELYADESRSIEMEIGETRATEVMVDNKLLLDHTYTDDDLHQLVKIELDNAFKPINEKSLLFFFQRLRDLTKENYLSLIGPDSH